MTTQNKTKVLVMCSLAIAINIILGNITSALKLPLYLDTLGTVLMAVYFGPVYGAAVGGLSNFISSMLTNPKAMPFLIVNVVIGLLVGFIAKKYKFDFKTALITGLILSIVAPLIGTPIGVWVYGGLTGTVSDVVVLWLKKSGTNIFAASFVAKVGNNLIDKIGTCLIAFFILKGLPNQYKPTAMTKK